MNDSRINIELRNDEGSAADAAAAATIGDHLRNDEAGTETETEWWRTNNTNNTIRTNNNMNNFNNHINSELRNDAAADDNIIEQEKEVKYIMGNIVAQNLKNNYKMENIRFLL